MGLMRRLRRRRAGHTAAHAPAAKAAVRSASKSHEAGHETGHGTGHGTGHEIARTRAEFAAEAKAAKSAKSRKAVEAPAVGRTRGGARGQRLLRAREEEDSRSTVKGRRAVKPAAGGASLHKEPARNEASPVAVAVVAKPGPVAVAAKPAPAAQPTVEADEPMVKHDRKHHLPADAAPAATNPPDTSKAGQAATMQVLGTDAVAEGSAVLYRRGRLIMPPAMKGSHDILVHQNTMADQDGLERVQDDDDLMRMRGAKTLLPLPDNAGLQTDDRLPGNRRFARPWTVKFLEAVAKAHYDRFHTPLQVNSAVRTVEFQRNLMRVNGNAAPAEGETASPHLTGQAVDLAKKGLSLTEIAWLRGYLLPLVQQGKIDVEEEFQQSCFHISVYRKYVPEAAPRREIVSRPVSGSAAIAAAM